MGELIEWGEHLMLGLAEIDRQHRELAESLNRLARDPSPEKASAVLHQLFEDVRDHFTYEEELMSEYAYDGYAEHWREHHQLLGELRHFTGRVDRGKETVDAAVFEELKVWLLAHVNISDRPLAEFLLKVAGSRLAVGP